MATFSKRSPMPVPAQTLFDWHARPGAFERLAPPWQSIRVLNKTGSIRDGDTLTMAVGPAPFSLSWHAIHQDFQQGKQFVDIQERGPFSSWRHLHQFEDRDASTSLLVDHIDYRLPMSFLGQAIAGRYFRQQLYQMFEFRHQRTASDLRQHLRFKSQDRLTVAVSGASGLVGKALCSFLSTGGHTIRKLVRRPARKGSGEIQWSVDKQSIDQRALEGVDAIIHLAGESISSGRWSDAQKKRILDSRIKGTALLARAAAALKTPPKVMVSASAIGYYGDRADELMNEDSDPGSLFLSEVCQQWETSAKPAQDAGIRVVFPRLGVILSQGGGALPQMLWPFKLGLGGPIGSGQQYLSWVSIDDVVGAIHHLLMDSKAEGPVNVVAPQAMPQGEFACLLGGVLNRPAVVPLPKAIVRAAMGEMGSELLLASQRVEAQALDRLGYNFLFPTLIQCLRFELGRFRAAEHPAPQY